MYVYHFGSLLQSEHFVYHLSLELCCRRRFHDNPAINHKHIFYFVFIFFSQWLCISYHLHIVIVSFISVHVLFVVVIKLQIFEEFMKKGANCKSIYNSNLSKNMIGLHHQKGKKKYIITHIEKWYMPAVRCVFKKKIKPTKHKH